jgi:Na+/H+-dicarboxylate symporter
MRSQLGGITRLSTTARVLIGLALGMLVGVLSTLVGDDFAARLASIVAPVGTLWLNALRMTVVPLVVSLVIVGVTDASSAAAAGRATTLALGLFIALLAAVATSTALVAPAVYSLWPGGPVSRDALLPHDGGHGPALPGLADQLANLLPSNAIAAAAGNAMVPLVLFSLIFGFALTRLPALQRAPLIQLLRAIGRTMLVIVGWVLKAAPVGVFALILPVAAKTGTGLLGAAGWFVFVQSCIQGSVLLAMYPVAVGLGGVAFARFARAAAPAQGVGFGTQSSLATLPVMLDAATRRLDIPSRIAGVVLPLAVSLFRVTSPANTLGAACFVAWLYGVDLSFMQLASGALVAIIVALGSVSLPGQVTFAASHIPVLLAMGLPLEPVALMLALDPIPDAFRTAGNVTGDLAVTTVVARHDAGDVAPVPDAAPGTMESAT